MSPWSWHHTRQSKGNFDPLLGLRYASRVDTAKDAPKSQKTSSKGRYIFFALAAAFALTAFFHFSAAVCPDIDPEAPTWRHLLFVGINIVCVIGFVCRPLAFIPFFALLTIQQIASHGTHAARLWCRDGRVDFPSIAVVLVVPFALYCLVADALRRRAFGEAGRRRPSAP